MVTPGGSPRPGHRRIAGIRECLGAFDSDFRRCLGVFFPNIDCVVGVSELASRKYASIPNRCAEVTEIACHRLEYTDTNVGFGATAGTARQRRRHAGRCSTLQHRPSVYCVRHSHTEQSARHILTRWKGQYSPTIPRRAVRLTDLFTHARRTTCHRQSANGYRTSNGRGCRRTRRLLG